MKSIATQMSPRIAVVTPVFRHSALLCEAIESVLNQRADFPIHLVLVNDGCPHRETEEVCLEYASTYPSQITYLKKANGGLSSARNHGIQHVLTHWPGVEAVYLLDADNRLRTAALQKAMDILDRDPTSDWVYPNIDMFGLPAAYDYGGDYSYLNLSVMNTCEAGSLVRRRVFEAGVLFDTNMKLGFEDWDFFISASEKGFRGCNLEDFGFQYRKRPESMLADSTRDQEEILGYMKRKHRAFFNPRHLVGLEQSEAPRYAIYLADTGEYLLTVDPDAPADEISPAEFEKLLFSTWTAKSRIQAPGHFIVTTKSAIQALREAKLLHWIFWRLEEVVESNVIATVTLDSATSDVCRIVEEASPSDGQHLQSILLAVGPKLFEEVLRDTQSAWIDSVVQTRCEPRMFNVRLSAANTHDLEHASGYLVHSFLAQLHRLRASRFRPATQRDWGWRQQGIPVRNRAFDAARRQLSGGIACPRLATAGSKNIGFVLPLVEFGGVEKVALNIARALKAEGWTPHLVVADKTGCTLSAEFRDVFASVSFLCDSEHGNWGGDAWYFGTVIPQWAQGGRHGRALGLLHWLDVVVNCHGSGMHGLMGQLRRLGITTIASLHLSDETEFGRPVGHSYLGLAFEHAYDVIVTCSHQLSNWCHGMGIPEEKVLSVPNAPSYPLSSAQIAMTLRDRATRTTSERLRVLFLGRLDRQKGLHKLEAVFDATRELRLPIEWRVVGKSVVDSDQSGLSRFKEVLEPPIYDPQDLTHMYEWADVLILLSDFEGLPLTILEAMRLGVTCISTDVGAIGEVATNGHNAILLNPHTAVPDCVAALQLLANDRELCRSIGAAAAQSVAHRTWGAAVEPLAQRLSKPSTRSTTDSNESENQECLMK